MIPKDPGPIGAHPAVLVVDVQHDFVHEDGAVPCAATSDGVGGPQAVVENINTLVQAAREADVPVVWGKETHRLDLVDYGSEILCGEAKHTMEGTVGESFIEGLDVDEDDLGLAEYVVEKRVLNLFHRTDLETILGTYDVDTVLIVGAATNVCVHYTAHGAHEHDYVYRVVEEGTAGTSEEMHESALDHIQYLQPEGVQSLETVISALNDYDGNPVVQRVKDAGSVFG